MPRDEDLLNSGNGTVDTDNADGVFDIEGNGDEYFVEGNEAINEAGEEEDSIIDNSSENDELNTGFEFTRSDIKKWTKKKVSSSDQESDEVEESDELNVSLGFAHSEVEIAKNKLLESKDKRWGITFRDSTRMRNVKNAIRSLQALMPTDQKLPDSFEDFKIAHRKILDGYQRLIDSCQTYVSYIESKGKGKTDSGKNRLNLTKQILKQSRREMVAFEVPSQVLYNQFGEEESWHHIIYNVRAEKISDLSGGVVTIEGRKRAVPIKTDEQGNKSYITTENETLTDEGKANTSVSASRLAEMFGMGDVVQKSSTVLVQTNGELARGTSTQVVEGMNFRELMDHANKEGITLTLDPRAISQLCGLKLFDIVCGRPERDMSDIVPKFTEVSEKEYNITDVVAINNTITFGGSPEEVAKNIQNYTPTDEELAAAFPFIPIDLHSHLVSWPLEDIMFDQMDIRNDDEIKIIAAKKEQLGNQLTRLISNGKIKLCLTEYDWYSAKNEMKNMKDSKRLRQNYIPIDLL